jgi:hypothetical protein
MLYLEVLMTGIVGGLLAAILWFVVAFLFPIFGPMLTRRLLKRGGMSGASISSNELLIAALIGFIVAGFWGLRHFVTH